ncbi:MAG: hypothetical protein KF764_16725 [Labilithrix sp.]|nr:hypothetical protein [Labilithrix sp.]
MLLLSTGLASLMLQASCARSVEDTPYDGWRFESGITVKNACIQTECPAPFATCEGTRGLCTVDLRSDVDHCGACDSPCPRTTTKTPWSYVCSEGKCQMACAPFYADCNGSTADGCETSVRSDPANCGACGAACAEGVICWKGACGCPSGFTQCGDDCVRLDSDNQNCGACGSVCQAPESDADPRWTCGPGVMPPRTKWMCGDSACTLQCRPPFANCNKDLCGDGCEIDLSTDRNNCGACGNACAADQWCQNGTCNCPAGLTRCGDYCVDIATDPNHCGGCGNYCVGPPSSSGKGGPTCQGGECGYVCFPGFADCDGDIDNGCEANLETSQRNCGACGTQCDVAGGQPCVRGECLTKPCEEPVVR